MPPPAAKKGDSAEKGKKPPPKGKTKEPEPPSEEELLREEATEMAAEVVADVLQGVYRELEGMRMVQLSAVHAATHLRESMMNILEMVNIDADPGETDLLDNTWTVDEEPVAVQNDTWSRDILALMGPMEKLKARGMVKSKHHVKLHVPGAQNPRLSTASSAASEKSRNTLAGMGVPSAAQWAAHAHTFDDPPPPKGREDQAQTKLDLAAVEAETKRLPQRADSDIDAYLTPASRMQRRMSRERLEDARRVEALRENFKGRDYEYTLGGQVVPATPVLRPEQLPNVTVASNARVSEDVFLRDTLAANDARGKAVRINAAARRRRSVDPHGTQALLHGQNRYELEPQPAILDVVMPSAGVRVIERGHDVYGGDIPIDPDNLPRKVYEKLADGKPIASVVGAEERARSRERLANEEARSGSRRVSMRNSLSRSSSRSASIRSSSVPGADPAMRPATSGAVDPFYAVDRSLGDGDAGAGGDVDGDGLLLEGRPTSSPSRDAWPRTADWQMMRQRERSPAGRHNLPTNEKQMSRLENARRPATKKTAAVSRGTRATMTVHSVKRRDSMLKVESKRRADRE